MGFIISYKTLGGFKMSFLEEVKKTILEDYNDSYTENGAKGYKTTGKNLLDMNFKIPSYN